MQLAKWGNSYAVRLPKEMVDKLKLELGEELDARVQDGALRIRRKRTHEEIVESLRRFEGTITGPYIFDREEANAR